MQNQNPIEMVIDQPAEYLKRHSSFFVRSGPRMMSPEEVALRKIDIERCAEEMRRSKTYSDYESALAKAHQLGVFVRNDHAYQVAQASLMAD